MADEQLPQLDLSKSTPANAAPGGAPNLAGVSLDMSKSQGTNQNGTAGQPQAAPVHNDELKVTHPWYTPTGVAQRAGSALEGVGEGVLSTGAGIADIGDKVAHKLNSNNPEHSQASQTLHHLAGDDNTPGSSNNYNKLGYGGETVLEMIMGDEALKGLSTADRALQAGKTLKTLEKSPKLLQALKEGATKLAASKAGQATEKVAEHATKAAIVQGGQTYVRSGGDTKEAAESALMGAGTAGVLGGAGGVVGSLARKAGKAGESAASLAETAANAPDKQTLAQNIQGQLLNSKTALHDTYEKGINDIQERLGSNSVEVKGSPVSQTAEDLLKKPDPDDHDLTKAAKELAGDKLSKDTREILESYANGTKPLTEEDIAAAKEASKPSGLVGADGKPVQATAVEPQAQAADPLTARDLVAQRQAIREAAAKYEPGDINARVLNRLLFSFDDTMDQIAAKSGDANAVKDYQSLRGDYKAKIGVYNNNPVIKNLMDGKVDDAAKGFIATKSASGLPTAGKMDLNTRDLKTVLGEEGFNHFRTAVFDNLLQTASDKNGFNPAKFMTTWGKIADGTKGDFFGTADASIAPQNYVTALAQDAKTASNMQKLTRAGLIAGPGAAASSLSPAVGGVATVLAFIAGHEGAGGIAKGRDILDYVANHPRTWNVLRRVGKAADSPVAGKVGSAVDTAVRGSEQASNTSDAQAQIQQATERNLSGPPTNPKQGDSQTTTAASLEAPVVVTPSFTNTNDLVKPGNIDLNARPDIKNSDGSHSSVFSMSFGTDDGEVLVPGVGDGKTYPLRKLTTKEALDQYHKTGKNLGTFKTPKAADAYGATLHKDQSKMKVVNGTLKSVK